MIRFDKGYSLAVMIIMTTFILAVLAAAYRVTTRSYIYSREEYYYKLAQEAGESGTVAANACLDINNWKQTWGHVTGAAGLYLTPSSDCKGQDGKIPTRTLSDTQRLGGDTDTVAVQRAHYSDRKSVV